MIDRGWTVLLRELRRLVRAQFLRRALLVGVIAAIASAAVLVVLGLTVRWFDLPGDLAGVVVLALAVGVCAVAFVPLPRVAADGSRLYWSGWQMQAPDPSERYFRMRSAPTVAPADRDDVLRDGRAVLAGVVPDVARGIVILVGLVVGSAGLALFDSAPRFLVFVALMTTIRTFAGLHRLGRVDRAMRIAETLPARDDDPAHGDQGHDDHGHGDRRHGDRRHGDAAEPSPARGRSHRAGSATRRRTGTKLGLPGDDD